MCGIFQTLRTKCESLSRGMSRLEDKCANLACTVDSLNVQLEQSVQNEADLKVVYMIRIIPAFCFYYVET